MTDFESFTEMLDKAGFNYSVEENKPVFYEYKPEYTLVTVKGCFYDTLTVYFDRKGDLIQMSSHVAFHSPSSRKANELYKEMNAKEGEE